MTVACLWHITNEDLVCKAWLRDKKRGNKDVIKVESASQKILQID
jgi:hypothetical protein